MDLGEKIKSLRKQRGLRLQDVADVVGVGKSTVRKWENGEIKNMGRDKIALVAKALNVSPGFLMGWEATEENDSSPDVVAENFEARIITKGINAMSPEDRQRALAMMRLAFASNAHLFEESEKHGSES